MRKNGFTLIELMIVVVINGILAAIAIPNFISMQDRARDATIKSNVHTILLGIEDFNVRNNGTYPNLLADVQSMAPASLRNPYNAAQTGAAVIAAEAGATAGQIGWTGGTASYTLTGHGKNNQIIIISAPGT